MKIDVKRLEQVLVVARTGSFTRAAEELHISQPALSRSIQLLEERFGVRLFERGRAGVELTAVGRLAVAEAEELLRRADAFERNLRLYGKGEAGEVAFGMGPLVGGMLLPGLSIYSLSRWPGLTLRASVKTVEGLLEELFAGSIEMLFCSRLQVTAIRGLALERLGSVEIAMLTRAGHPLATRQRVTATDISPYPILSGAELSASTRRTRGAFICDNYQILRETALGTDGIWMSSPQFVAADLAAGRLVQLRLADGLAPTEVEVCMVSMEGLQLSPAARSISAYALEHFSHTAEVA